MGVLMDNSSKTCGGKRVGAGRPKGRSQRTYDLSVYYSLAIEALADGRLVLSVERAAFALGCHTASILSLIEQGDLPCVYVPTPMGQRTVSSPRIPAADLLQWIEKRSTHNAALRG
jgi:hypothetical protein